MQDFLLFKDCIIFHCVYISPILYPSKHLGRFHILAIINIECRYLFELLISIALDKYPEGRLQDHLAALDSTSMSILK